MEYQQIKTLLDRYFRGTSTLDEEKILRRYFSDSHIDARLEEYAPIFRLFRREQAREMDGQKAQQMLEHLPGAQARSRKLVAGRFRWIARIAAALVLSVGMWWAYQYQQTPDPTASVDWSKYEIIDERKALNITRGALFQASKTLNQGAETAADKMDRVQEIGKFFK